MNLTALITWMNQNNGFLLGLLTFAYVITTIVMVFIMFQSHKQTCQLEESRLRPMVLFNIESDGDRVGAWLKNFGVTPAYNVRVSCTPPLERFKKSAGSGGTSVLIDNTFPFLAPNQIIPDSIDVSHQFFENGKTPCFTGHVQYEDHMGKQHSEPFKIDLSPQCNRIHPAKYDTGKEIEHF